ncbi:MAG TPA: hypothetical protein V6D47_12900 [Oscillatoriaceae cyanobacterium]
MRGTAMALGLALVLGGCGSQPPLPVAAPARLQAPERAAATVEIAPRFAVLSLDHRWQATDIYQYTVSLKVWNGSAYVDLAPAVSVVVPQKSTPAETQAVLSNLKQGARYEVVVQVQGNAGGTAPSQVLNADDTGNTAVLDFTQRQDLENMETVGVSPTLDRVPFSGTATVAASNVPAGTDSFLAQLQDASSGAVIASLTYPATQTASFSHLRTGVNYTVSLTALQAGTAVASATSAPLYYDPSGQDLEQAQALAIAF